MIAGIIVTFNPDRDNLFKLISSLENDLSYICVVDNCSSNNVIDDQLFFSINKLEIVKLSDNFGIAYAQNIGIEKVVKNNANYVLFFDQDSSVESNFVQNLYEDYNEIKKQDIPIAAIGPRFIDERYNFYYPGLKLNNIGLIDKFDVSHIKAPCEASVLISSGTLVSIDALKEIGLMREEFFIDFVDTEWCFRALSKGYKIYISKKAFMKHSIGDDVVRIFNFNIPVHSAFRRYYRVRNLFFMWKISYIPKLLTSKLMISNFIHQILLILLKDKKLDYIKYYSKAIKDGIKQSRDYHV
ncbi:glycosyltransferase family 2 protein [Acinetobacter pittii]|nr:glycosyltransferase family 2 protein [Acinetobacter pittii]UFN53490.1 glycosyltransferase family 2 protein [Acinetobacter pittii]